jgi:hypothetical protein
MWFTMEKGKYLFVRIVITNEILALRISQEELHVKYRTTSQVDGVYCAVRTYLRR